MRSGLFLVLRRWRLVFFQPGRARPLSIARVFFSAVPLAVLHGFQAAWCPHQSRGESDR